MTHKFTWEENGVHFECFDMLDSNSMIKANSEIVGYDKLYSIKYVIWDTSSIKAYDIDEAFIEISSSFYVSAVNPHLPNVKLALVTKHKEIETLINKFIDLTKRQLPNAQMKYFESLTSARIWVSDDL